MPTIEELKARYFVSAADATPPSEPVPAQFDGCKVTPLVDASNFNAAVEEALTLVGTGPDAAANAGHMILIQNWWLGLSGGKYEKMSGFAGSNGPVVKGYTPYFLDGPPHPGPPPTGGTKVLADILKDKARLGVTVRVLGWCGIGTMGSSIYNYIGDALANVAPSLSIPYRSVNAATMKAVQDLRADETLRPNLEAMLNIIAHTAGGIHSKMMVVANPTRAIGFTGGLDFVNDRWAHSDHLNDEYWHDVAARVEGPAVQALYDWFQHMWQENLKRPAKRFRLASKDLPHFLPRTPAMPALDLPVDPQPENHSVQSLRTISAFNYKWYNCFPENPPVSFAPKGVFEVRTALHKALRAAQRFIYMEDQSFWTQEALGWAGEAIKANPDLRVILVTNGRTDPLDPAFPAGTLATAINHGLLEGLTPAQVSQARLYKRLTAAFALQDDSGAPATITITASALNGSTCQLATGIVAGRPIAKDVVAARNLELDLGGVAHRLTGNLAAATGETLVVTSEPVAGACVPPGTYQVLGRDGLVVHTKSTIIDDHWAIIGSANLMRRSLYTDFEHSYSFIDPAGIVVRDYRSQLWADHFGHPTPSDFHDIQVALHGWEASWGIAGGAPARPNTLVSIPLPITPDAKRSDKEQSHYDAYDDLDSRQDWGGLCP